MRLIKPSIEILFVNSDALQLIETAGRTCYKSEDKRSVDSAQNFIKMILKRGHESVIEHVTATVRFICDRGVSHEIVRHRIASYSQESTRYCDYSGGHVSFIIPPWVNISPDEYPIQWDDKLGGMSAGPTYPSRADGRQWFWAMASAEREYKALRELGWRPEQARSVLPNSLKTEIVMSANLREWRHFFKLRTSSAAHPQMREVAFPLLEEMKNRIPILFDSL
jgi:thymidylate synthase (FAD)